MLVDILKNIKQDEQHLKGITRANTVAWLISSVSSGGIKLAGLSYLIENIELDLLSGFFSAIGSFSAKVIKSITYSGDYGVWFASGTKLRLSLISLNAATDNTIIRENLESLIKNLESHDFLSRQFDDGIIDSRKFNECYYETLLKFPFYKVSEDYWKKYYPVVRSSLEEVRSSIPWCTGLVDSIIDQILPFLDGKRNIHGILESDALDEQNVLFVLDVLYYYKLLYYKVKYDPSELYVIRTEDSFNHKLASIFGPDYNRIMLAATGDKTVVEISRELEIPMRSLLFVIEKMIVEGALKIV